MPKVLITARQIAEIDPFIQVRVFPEGVREDNLQAFLHNGGKADLLVEVCDSLDMKIRLREACRRDGIPVVMDTSDRCMIDVERFDLEPDR
ncbi:ThiF family adenylyltransferase, partial [Arthrospira platensis SPKY1]|nr:ThiF family adenylyltransferase [Arthrospira platensis SPKY1]